MAVTKPMNAPPYKFEKTYQVTADHFTAGIVVSDDRIVRTAPILSWLRGEPFGRLQLIATGNRWKIQEVGKRNPEQTGSGFRDE
jgi:hypothetical protein